MEEAGFKQWPQDVQRSLRCPSSFLLFLPQEDWYTYAPP